MCERMRCPAAAVTSAVSAVTPVVLPASKQTGLWLLCLCTHLLLENVKGHLVYNIKDGKGGGSNENKGAVLTWR